jgi:putative acetyltransferase
MQCSLAHPNESSAIERLFLESFSAAEGPAEGDLIAGLVGQLLLCTPDDDLYCFVARDGQQMIGSILFSRITFECEIRAFILAPVAVHPLHQGQGIGQALIRFGLDVLLHDGVELVLTYGDPSFYSKVGFQPVTVSVIPAPLPLRQPEGWMAQSLTGHAIQPISGRSSCVEALSKPVFWSS